MSQMSYLLKRLSQTTLDLMRINPMTPTVRGLILKQTGLTVPETAKTFAEIMAWLEANIKPPEPLAIKVTVNVSERQSGTCTFSRFATGAGHVVLDEKVLLEIAGDSEDEDDFYNRLHEYISDESEKLAATDYDDVTTGAHEVTDTIGRDADFNMTSAVDNARAIVKERDKEMWEKISGPMF